MKAQNKKPRKPITKDRLNPREEEFCRLYSTKGSGAYGNITRAYCLAYGKDFNDEKQYNVAANLGWRLLKKVKIIKGIEEIRRPYVEQLEELRDRAVRALETKELKREQVTELRHVLKDTTHDVELLSGRPTERDAMQIDPRHKAKVDEVIARMRKK